MGSCYNVLAKVSLNCFYWTFVQGSTFILRLSFCDKNLPSAISKPLFASIKRLSETLKIFEIWSFNNHIWRTIGNGKVIQCIKNCQPTQPGLSLNRINNLFNGRRSEMSNSKSKHTLRILEHRAKDKTSTRKGKLSLLYASYLEARGINIKNNRFFYPKICCVKPGVRNT